MKFAFFTLGCKVNRFETQALAQLARARGHEIVEQDADAVVVNTCTVTSASDHKNLRAFHRLRRTHPRAVLAACGCFAQTAPERAGGPGGADLVCGTGDRVEVLRLCEEAVRAGRTAVGAPAAPSAVFECLPAGVPTGRTRALLKLQDGCDNFCSYCIIPYARGRSRSLPPEEALRQARCLAAAGVREIVLAGIEISAYGRDLPGEPSLTDMVEQLCAAVPETRIRLSSLDPRVIDEAFCSRLSALPNLMHHFHLSLQSGSDSVLRRMHRQYTAAAYLHRVEKLRAAFPHCAVTTDVIAGFPGETEREHAETMAFARRCAFAAMHVFPYSPRKGTVAARLPGQLPPQEKKCRANALKALARQMERTYLDTFVGTRQGVLLEHAKTPGEFAGHSRYHFTVHGRGNGQNRLVTVRITGRDARGLYGELPEK